MKSYHPNPKWVIWFNESESGAFPYDETGLAARIMNSLRQNGIECIVFDLKSRIGYEGDFYIPGGPDLPTLWECEKRLVKMALEAEGNQKKAAKRLGISARSMNSRVKKFGLVEYQRKKKD